MTTRQTDYGNGKKQMINPQDAGELCSILAVYDLSVGGSPALVAAADRVEMAVLPAFCKIADMVLIASTGVVATANVGLMSGTATDPDNARTVGSEFFSAVSINAAAANRMTAVGGFDIAPVDYDRGIGLTVSADIAQGAGRYLKLLIEYYK